MYHHNNRALANALGPDRPPSHHRAVKLSNPTRHGLLALALALTVIAALTPAVALARPAVDNVTTAQTIAGVGDTPVDFPGASRTPQQSVPATVEVARPERTIVRDVDPELPVIIAGVALLIAFAGAGYAHARIHALARRVTR